MAPARPPPDAPHAWQAPCHPAPASFCRRGNSFRVAFKVPALGLKGFVQWAHGTEWQYGACALLITALSKNDPRVKPSSARKVRGEGGSGAWRSGQGRLRGQACLGTATGLTRPVDGTGRRRGLRSAEGRGTCQLDGFEWQRARHVRARRAGERQIWPISTLGSRPVLEFKRWPTARSRTLSVFWQHVPGARAAAICPSAA